MIARDAHLNLVDSSRQLFELDPEAEIEAGEGWVFGAGRSSHPLISNAAFRVDDDLDPAELIARARDFFTSRGRGFALWARSGVDADGDLIETAAREGLQAAYAMPEMVLEGSGVGERPLPSRTELRRVASADDAGEYWQVATSAYASLGFPPEIFAFYERHDGLVAENAAAFLAYVGGAPAAIAMTILSHDVAGIYWVGTTPGVRARGLAWTVTAAAVNAGFELGARTASLQASPMGESLYRRMGFETIFDYKLLLCPAPEGTQ